MPPDPGPPLVVDLDGTLTPTDSLWESLLLLARERPYALIRAFFALHAGRAALKAQLAGLAQPDPAVLPLNGALLAWLRAQAPAGTLPLAWGALLSLLLLFAALGLSLILLPRLFSLVLLGYYPLTTAYSFGLKASRWWTSSCSPPSTPCVSSLAPPP